MLKHVAVSPHRARADSVSIASTASCCSFAAEHGRAASLTSLSDAAHTTTIKVYARCLRPDIEYKTLSVTLGTSSRELVGMLLRKVRMRHRDPNLFYLRMEVRVRSAGLRTALALDDHARPAALQLCHPKGYSKFSLQMRRGGLVKVHDSALMASSQYKSLLISERTTADELLAILLNCYNSRESVDRFTLYEVSASQEYQRKLHPDDLPLRVQQAWPADSRCYFLVRRNPDLRDLGPNVLWSSPYDTSKEHPYLSTLDDTLQSFSSLTLVEERSPIREGQFDIHHKTESKAEIARNRSIDSILEERCEKWGNYVNIRGADTKPLVKSRSCQCEKGHYCDCSATDNNNVTDCPPPSMVTSKSCHQIGCYSPVYKYPSISYWSPVNKSGPKSLDATSFSSMEASDTVTSTPNQSPITTSVPSTCSVLPNTPEHRMRGGETPVAAPRTKSLTPASPEYENYLYI